MLGTSNLTVELSEFRDHMNPFNNRIHNFSD
jgi:hypothetical protein